MASKKMKAQVLEQAKSESCRSYVKTVYKSAVTGKFVSSKYLKRYPHLCFNQVVRVNLKP